MNKKILFLFGLIIFITGCSSSPTQVIKTKINLDISKCKIENKIDEHAFNGDGDYFIIANCSESPDDILNQLSDWKNLPFSENLQIMMYGGKKGTTTYGHRLAEKIGIPLIENGYYYFVDRFAKKYNDIEDIYSDEALLDRSSFNFTIAIYDTDSDLLYYYEFDT